MAKAKAEEKKAEPVPAPVAQVDDSFNLSGAIKDAFEKHGLDAPRDVVLSFIKTTKGKEIDKDFKTETFGSTLSSIRNKLKGKDGAPRAAKATSSEPTLNMKPAELLTLLERINEIGDTKVMAQCLEYLAE